ncbi:MAG: hypothetical protein ACTHMT_11050, partial [Verrucomicrobiota bacterium]
VIVARCAYVIRLYVKKTGVKRFLCLSRRQTALDVIGLAFPKWSKWIVVILMFAALIILRELSSG